MLLIPTVLIGMVLEPGVSYSTCFSRRDDGGRRRRQLRVVDDEHQPLLPVAPQGLGSRGERGGGNLGVPVVQLVGLLVLATLGSQHPRALVVIYIPLIILSALGAALMMNNLTRPATPRAPSAR